MDIIIAWAVGFLFGFIVCGMATAEEDDNG